MTMEELKREWKTMQDFMALMKKYNISVTFTAHSSAEEYLKRGGLAKNT